MHREVNVYLYDELAGNLSQKDDVYCFVYDGRYEGPSVSQSLPVRNEPYYSKGQLHPYFASLAPEGWLRRVYSTQQRIDEHDLFGILMENGDNLIGAIQLRRPKK